MRTVHNFHAFFTAYCLTDRLLSYSTLLLKKKILEPLPSIKRMTHNARLKELNFRPRNHGMEQHD